jgi:hypothetical protein
VTPDAPSISPVLHNITEPLKVPDPNVGLPPRYLRTPEAARFVSLSGRTLEKHRTTVPAPLIENSADVLSTLWKI